MLESTRLPQGRRRWGKGRRAAGVDLRPRNIGQTGGYLFVPEFPPLLSHSQVGNKGVSKHGVAGNRHPLGQLEGTWGHLSQHPPSVSP